MATKIDRALYGPSLFEITLGALLSILLGVVLAVAFMVLKPVEVVKALPKEDERVQGVVYYVEGSKDASRGKGYIRKRQQLMDGTPATITLSEDELNSWFMTDSSKKKAPAPKVAPKTPAKPGQAAPAATDDVSDELVTYSDLNFRLHDGVMQVGMPASINLSMASLALPVVVQTEGKFEKEGDMLMFVPSSTMIGSLQLDRFPGVTKYLRTKIMKIVPENVLTAWKKVSAAEIDGKTLKLTIQ